MTDPIRSARTVSIAPMMDCTDRHDRFFLRLISKHVLLYSEMVTQDAIIHGDRKRFLTFNEPEHPVALQLGGSDPKKLAECAKVAEDWGYDEVNLNVGCPSDRVKAGRIGASLMAEPETVAECMAAMKHAVDIPVTIKTRIGIDRDDQAKMLYPLVEAVAATGCEVFIIHARKAWLDGLSPKENREIPPLRYDIVRQLKKDFPQLHISINGGIKTADEIDMHLQHVDGVMIGREPYSNPYMLADIDQRFYSSTQTPLSRHQVIESLIPYMEQQLAEGVPLHHITRHIHGLFHGLPGARSWRQALGKCAPKFGAGLDILKQALRAVPDVPYGEDPEAQLVRPM